MGGKPRRRVPDGDEFLAECLVRWYLDCKSSGQPPVLRIGPLEEEFIKGLAGALRQARKDGPL